MDDRYGVIRCPAHSGGTARARRRIRAPRGVELTEETEKTVSTQRNGVTESQQCCSVSRRLGVRPFPPSPPLSEEFMDHNSIRLWQSMTTVDARRAAERDPVVILPLAAIEQHGPHLPLSTDLDIGMGRSEEHT